MRADREKAMKLRLVGKSYNEITKALGVPKGTLSNWFSGLALSEVARKRIKERVHAGSLRGLLRRNTRQTRLAQERMKAIRSKHFGDISLVTVQELKLIGVALYWAEGYKRPIVTSGRTRTHHPLALSNSDPELIRLYMRFLREVCGVRDERMTASIRAYEHMNERRLIEFWKDVTLLPQNCFRKTYYGVSKSSQGKRPFNRLPHGTIMIRVNDTSLFHKVMGWIEGLAWLSGRQQNTPA